MRAEADFTIRVSEDGKTWQCGGDPDRVEFPLLISLCDKDGVPVKGAVVALKRLGPSGWSEEEIVREADSRTDKNGMILVMYPAMAKENSSGESSFEIHGAVTVVAEGHQTVTIELRDYFKDGRYVVSDTTVPHLKLKLTDLAGNGKKPQIPAQQDATGQPATRPESK